MIVLKIQINKIPTFKSMDEFLLFVHDNKYTFSYGRNVFSPKSRPYSGGYLGHVDGIYIDGKLTKILY